MGTVTRSSVAFCTPALKKTLSGLMESPLVAKVIVLTSKQNAPKKATLEFSAWLLPLGEDLPAQRVRRRFRRIRGPQNAAAEILPGQLVRIPLLSASDQTHRKNPVVRWSSGGLRGWFSSCRSASLWVVWSFGAESVVRRSSGRLPLCSLRGTRVRIPKPPESKPPARDTSFVSRVERGGEEQQEQKPKVRLRLT